MGYFFAIAFMVDKIQAAETKKIMTGIFIAAIIFYSAVTVRQNFYWSRPFEFFKKITQLSPRSFAAFNILGLLYEEKGLYPSAEENYRESIELNPGYYEANVNLGRLYSKSGRGFEAERLFNKAIIIDKNRPESFSLLGYLYLDRGQPDKASGYFNKSVGLRSRGSFLYHVESGIIKRLRREYNQAIKEFEMAILINPENSLVFNNLGTVYKLQGNFDAAIACYQQALKFDRWFSAAYGNLAVVYAILNDNRAEYYFNKALEISPNDVSMIFNLGLYYFENGRKDLAYKYFLKVLKLEPTHKLAKEYLEKSGK
jgi:tetratricopeptide (TPR) repeat protein